MENLKFEVLKNTANITFYNIIGLLRRSVLLTLKINFLFSFRVPLIALLAFEEVPLQETVLELLLTLLSISICL